MKATDPVINIGIDARVLQIVKKKGAQRGPFIDAWNFIAGLFRDP